MYIYCSKGNKTPMSEVDNLRRILENNGLNYKFYSGSSGDYDNTDCVSSDFLIVLPLTNMLKPGENPSYFSCGVKTSMMVSERANELANGKPVNEAVSVFSVGRGGFTEIIEFSTAKGCQETFDKVVLFYNNKFYLIRDYAEYPKPDWQNGYAAILCTDVMDADGFMDRFKRVIG